MPEILLVNPRKRKTARRKKPMARRRSAAQKRATAKMIAANRRRKRPVRRRRKVARKTPVKRRRRRAGILSRAKRKVNRRRGGVRRIGNPRLTMRSVQNQVMEAGTGAVGALGLDIVQGYLPIPANLKVGIVGTGVKALLAIGMGVVASNFKMIRGTTANRMVNGALTVVLHDELKKLTQQFAPGIQMGEYIGDDGMGYYGSGYPAGIMGEGYGGMGTYLPELQTDDMGLEQDGLGMYESGNETEYIEDMAYL